MLVLALPIAMFGVLPGFLAGAFAVELKADVGASAGTLGASVSALFVVSIVGSWPAGVLVQRRGYNVGVTAALLLGCAGLLLFASARGVVGLFVSMMVSGCGNAFVQPAVNQMLLSTTGTKRLGAWMGVKQASIPTATLIAGLAVPLVVQVASWRVVPALLSVLALLVLMAFRGSARGGLGNSSAPSRRHGGPRIAPWSLRFVGAGGALAMGACTALGVFIISGAREVGFATNEAAVLVVVCSMLGIGARVGFGFLADHFHRVQFNTIGAMLLGAVAGYLLLATTSSWGFVVGAIVCYVLGFSWNGLFHYSVVLASPDGAARATGVVQVGLSSGAALGPTLFGLGVDHASFGVAWTCAGAISLIAAVVLWLTRVDGTRSL